MPPSGWQCPILVITPNVCFSYVVLQTPTRDQGFKIPLGGKETEFSLHFSNILRSSGLYYKTIKIVTMTIVSDATIWSVTYDCN